MSSTSLESILTSVMLTFRWVGITAISIVSMALLISEAAKSKLSPAKIFTVAGSGVLAGVLFWVLPTVIFWARGDAETIVPSDSILYN